MRLEKTRQKVQLLSLVLLNGFLFKSWQGYRPRTLCVPVLNCHGCPAGATTCPVGLMGDMFRIGAVPWLAIGAFGLVGAVIGRFSCGWICPFGFVQDLLAKLPTPKLHLPRWTGWIKYVVLAVMCVFVPYYYGTKTLAFFCRICPASVLTVNTWYMQIGWEKALAFVLFLLLMLFVRRGFCRLACPIGAGLSLLNPVALLSLKFERRWCSDCMQCMRGCPVDLAPMDNPRDMECVYCARCLRCTGMKMDFSKEA